MKRVIIIFLLSFLVIMYAFSYDQLSQNKPDKKSTGSLLEIGGSFGIPAFFNLCAGFRINSFGIRLAGMYTAPNFNGIQLDIIYTIATVGRWQHGIGAVGGKSQDIGTDWAYAGLVYNLYWRNFFLEAGAVMLIYYWRGNFTTPYFFPGFQIGYMFHLPISFN